MVLVMPMIVPRSIIAYRTRQYSACTATTIHIPFIIITLLEDDTRPISSTLSVQFDFNLSIVSDCTCAREVAQQVMAFGQRQYSADSMQSLSQLQAFSSPTNGHKTLSSERTKATLARSTKASQMA